MKLFYRFEILCCIFSLGLNDVMAERPRSTAEQIAAESVAERYCTALASGDVHALKLMLGGEFLKQNMQLLGNPTYPDVLRERYSNAYCEVLESKRINPGHVEVSISIELDGDERIKSRLALMREVSVGDVDAQFRIVSEELE